MDNEKLSSIARKFHCTVCDAKFNVMRPMKTVRCRECGSLKTQQLSLKVFNDEQRKKLEHSKVLAEDPVTKYACIDCAVKFEWENKLRLSPTCPKCRGTQVVAISPTARLLVVQKTIDGLQSIAQKGPLTAKDAKRIRFVRKQWKMRCELKEWIEGFSNKIERLGFDGQRIASAQEMLRAMLVEVDHKQQELLQQYSEGKPVVKVG